MIGRFKEFIKDISLSYKYIIKIKTYGIKKYGLKGSHVMCLLYIGEANNGITAIELCKLCCEDKAAISKSLSALHKKKYIKLENDENKKYRSLYFLTEEGKKVYENVRNKILYATENVGSGLSDEDRNTFYKSLNIIVGNLDAVAKKFCEDQDE